MADPPLLQEKPGERHMLGTFEVLVRVCVFFREPPFGWFYGEAKRKPTFWAGLLKMECWPILVHNPIGKPLQRRKLARTFLKPFPNGEGALKKLPKAM